MKSCDCIDIHLLTSLITRRSLPYKSFFVTLSKICGNCTKAISRPFSSSIKKQSASLIDSELFEYMSQSTLRIISPLLIFEDTLICNTISPTKPNNNRHKKAHFCIIETCFIFIFIYYYCMLNEITNAFIAPALKL